MAKFTQLFKEIQDNSITPSKTTFCGDLSLLETTAKDNLVNAINELKNSGGSEETATLLWSGSLKFYNFDSATDVISNDEAKTYKKFILICMMNGSLYSSVSEHPYDTNDLSNGQRNWYFKIPAGQPRTYGSYRYIPLGGMINIVFRDDKKMSIQGSFNLSGLKINTTDNTITGSTFSDSLSPEWSSNGYITKLYGIK